MLCHVVWNTHSPPSYPYSASPAQPSPAQYRSAQPSTAQPSSVPLSPAQYRHAIRVMTAKFRRLSLLQQWGGRRWGVCTYSLPCTCILSVTALFLPRDPPLEGNFGTSERSSIWPNGGANYDYVAETRNTNKWIRVIILAIESSGSSAQVEETVPQETDRACSQGGIGIVREPSCTVDVEVEVYAIIEQGLRVV